MSVHTKFDCSNPDEPILDLDCNIEDYEDSFAFVLGDDGKVNIEITDKTGKYVIEGAEGYISSPFGPMKIPTAEQLKELDKMYEQNRQDAREREGD